MVKATLANPSTTWLLVLAAAAAPFNVFSQAITCNFKGSVSAYTTGQFFQTFATGSPVTGSMTFDYANATSVEASYGEQGVGGSNYWVGTEVSGPGTYVPLSNKYVFSMNLKVAGQSFASGGPGPGYSFSGASSGPFSACLKPGCDYPSATFKAKNIQSTYPAPDGGGGGTELDPDGLKSFEIFAFRIFNSSAAWTSSGLPILPDITVPCVSSSAYVPCAVGQYEIYGTDGNLVSSFNWFVTSLTPAVAVQSPQPPTVLAQQYLLADLGTLGGNNSYGTGINSNGQVTGSSDRTEAGGGQHAFIYSNGSMRDLGTFGGPDSYGNAINAEGQVTGYAYLPGNATYHAFLYSNDSMKDLGASDGTVSAGQAINSSGQVTGYYSDTNEILHAFLSNGTTLTDLSSSAPLVGCGGFGNGFTLSTTSNSVGAGLNTSGQVAGYANVNVDGLIESQGFVIDNGTTLTGLGTLGGSRSFALGINDSGIAVGYAFIAGDGAYHAFRSINGVMEDLDTFGSTSSYGEAINNAGQVTGRFFPNGAGTYHAFLYTNGAMNDLNALISRSSPLYPYVTLTDAAGINDNSWIVANGVDSRTGLTHAYILTPLSVVLSATSLSFAAESIHVRSASKSLTLTNKGSTTVPIVSISLDGSQADDFALSKTCGSTLAAGASCTISVTFTPMSAGAKAASISIADSANGSPETVQLSGTGVAAGSSPTVIVNPSLLAFASQQTKTTSSPKAVTLTNSGGASLSISSIGLVGNQADDFTLSKTCGTTLAAGASCTISATFTPVSAGAKLASISVADSATGSPQTIQLNGTGVAAGSLPVVTLSTTSLAFSSQKAKTTSASESVTVTNSGGASLSISSITLGGGQADDFALSKTCGSTLAAGASCTISATFTPVSAGAKTASINIADNASGSPQVIRLGGTGV